MNLKQKIIVGLATLLIVLTGLFPPYEGEYRREGDNLKRYLGYYSLFKPPSPNEVAALFTEYGPRRMLRGPAIPKEQRCRAYIDITRVGFQIAIIVLTAVGITLLAGNKRKNEV